ncbi:MAG: alpha/beta fold hydrolase [Minicystis sp.]
MRCPPLATTLLALLVTGTACHLEIPMTQTPAQGTHAASPTNRPPILGPEASPIDFERIARFPEPGLSIPRAIAYSPDGALITFLQSESRGEHMALFGFDVATGKARVLVRGSDLQPEDKPQSREEELRRERQRQRFQGVTGYQWARRAPVMLIPYAGDLFLRAEGGTITRLTHAASPAIDPQLSDDGAFVAFVREGELALLDTKTKQETALTSGATEGVTRGLSDFLAQEEMDEPSGFFWSPSGDRIAYLEVDERKVGTVPVLGHRNRRPDFMEQRYPLAGKRNPAVRAGVIQVATKATTWIEAPKGDRYLGRFAWTPDGKALLFQSLSRDQKQLTVLRADPATGATTTLWTESSATWSVFTDVHLLGRSPRVVTTVSADGHIHLDLRSTETGALLAPLTRGDWDVDSIAGVDEEQGLVYFVGTKTSALERHLYAVPLTGGEITKITAERGVHGLLSHGAYRLTMDRAQRGFVDVHSASDRLPRAEIRGADGKVRGLLPLPEEPDLAALHLRTPKLVEVQSAAGDTLHGALLEPRHVEPGRRYPVIVMVYGGPGVQLVLDHWSPRLIWQHLADRGFAVFQLDNRGSSGRGPAFQAPIYKRCGQVELEDQLAGLDYLATLPFIDAKRAGIYGHSYGGFMAATAMLGAPGRFAVGVSGSPVTDWSFYDTAYTERYMSTPEDNAEGYAATDVARHAAKLQGKLFVIHALMDENVHFDNTAHLIDALVTAEKKFDLLVFPGERHGYRTPAARKYAMLRVVDYFVENL